MAASFFFGLAALTRTTGVLLSIYIACAMLPKIWSTQSCLRLLHYLMVSWFCAIFVLSPIFAVNFVTPYKLYCETKTDRSDEVAGWCLDALPNVYGYIQRVYWDNRLFGMMHRSVDKTLVSVPMFLIALQFNIAFWRQKSSLPDYLYFCANMLIMLLFANADVNSRVASTCLFYYFSAAKGWSRGGMVKMHNLGYLLLNLVLFVMEVGFV